MKTIAPDEVTHVANLARLEFNEEQTEQLTLHLARVLAYIAKLNELDTYDVRPTSHVLPIHSVVKEDTVQSSCARDLISATAPELEDGYFEVPKVIE